MTLTAQGDVTYAETEAALGLSAGFIPQLSRYSVASVVALATDFTVYLTLCAFAVNAPVAGVTGYAVGMVAHYALSSRFVFDISHAQKSATRRMIEFAASGLLGLSLTGSIIAVLTEYFAASAIVAKGAAVVASFIAVFLVRRWIVFAPATTEKDLGLVPVYPKSVSSN